MKNRNKITILVVFFTLIGCESTKERELVYVYKNGDLVSQNEVSRVEEKCNYNEAIRGVIAPLAVAASVGETTKNDKDENTDLENARDKISKANQCIRDNGLYLIERVKP